MGFPAPTLIPDPCFYVCMYEFWYLYFMCVCMNFGIYISHTDRQTQTDRHRQTDTDTEDRERHTQTHTNSRNLNSSVRFRLGLGLRFISHYFPLTVFSCVSLSLSLSLSLSRSLARSLARSLYFARALFQLVSRDDEIMVGRACNVTAHLLAARVPSSAGTLLNFTQLYYY